MAAGAADVMDSATLDALFERYAGEDGAISKATCRERLQLLEDDPKAGDASYVAVIDALFDMLDTDGNGTLQQAEFRTAFDIRPAEMFKIFVEGPSSESEPVRELFRWHTGGAALLSTEYARQRMEEITKGISEVEARRLVDLFMESLGLDRGEPGLSEGGFLRVYAAHRQQMSIVFGIPGSAPPSTTPSAPVSDDESESGEGSPFGALGGHQPDEGEVEFRRAVSSGEFDELVSPSGRRAGRPSSAIFGMADKKVEALKIIFNHADSNQSGSISADELLRVLSDEDLGGVLAKQMRESFGDFSERFTRTMLEKLDRNGDGEFDFNEFAHAFGSIISDDGEYVPEKSVSGAQLFALTKEYQLLKANHDDMVTQLHSAQLNYDHKVAMIQSTLTEHERMTQRAEDESRCTAESLRDTQSELQNRRKTLDQIQRTLDAAQDDAAQFKAEKEAAEANAKRLASEKEHFRFLNSELEERLGESDALVEELEGKLAGLRSANQSRRGSPNEELHTSLMDAQMRMDELLEAKDSAAAHIEELQSELTAKDCEIKELAHKIAELQATLKDRTSELESIRRLKESQEQEFTERIEAIKARVTSEVVVVNLQLEKAVARAEEAERHFKDEHDARQRTEDSLAALQTALERGTSDRSAEARSLSAKLERTETECSRQAAAADESRQQLALYIHNHKNEIESYSRQLEALLSELANAKRAADVRQMELERDNNGYKDEITRMRMEIEEHGDSQRTWCQALDEANRRLQERLNNETKHCDSLKKALVPATVLSREANAVSMNNLWPSDQETRGETPDAVCESKDPQLPMLHHLVEENRRVASVSHEREAHIVQLLVESTSKCTGLSLELQEAKDMIDKLQQKLGTAKERETDLQLKLTSSIRGELDANARRVKELEDDYKSRLEAKDVLINEHMVTIDDLHRQLAESRTALASAQAESVKEISRLSKELRSAHDALAEAGKKMSTTEDELATATQNIAKLKSDRDALSDELKRQKEDIRGAAHSLLMACQTSEDARVQALQKAGLQVTTGFVRPFLHHDDTAEVPDYISEASKAARQLDRMSDVMAAQGELLHASRAGKMEASDENDHFRLRLARADAAAENLHQQCEVASTKLNKSKARLSQIRVHKYAQRALPHSAEPGPVRSHVVDQSPRRRQDSEAIVVAADKAAELLHDTTGALNGALEVLDAFMPCMGELDDRMSDSTKKIAQLEESLSQALRDRDALEIALGHDRNALTTSQNEVRTLQTDFRDLETRLKELQGEIGKRDSALETSKAEALRVHHEKGDLQLKLQIAQSEIYSLTAKLARQEDEIRSLEEEAEDARQEARRQRERADTAERKVAAAGVVHGDQHQLELSAAHEQSRQLQAQCNSLAKELLDAEQRCDRQQNTLDGVQAALDMAKHNTQHAEAKILALEKRLQALDSAADQACRDRDDALDQLMSSRREVFALKLKVGDLEQAAAAQNAVSDSHYEQTHRGPSLENELAELSAALIGLQGMGGQESVLNARLQRANAKVNELSKSLELCQASQREAELKTHTAEAEANATQARLRSTERRLDTLRARVSGLEDANSRAQELEIMVSHLESELIKQKLERHAGHAVPHSGNNGAAMSAKATEIQTLKVTLADRNAQISNLKATIKGLIDRWQPSVVIERRHPHSPPHSPPVPREAIATPPRPCARSFRHPVFRLERVRVVQSNLASQIRLPTFVNLELTGDTISVTGRDAIDTWPLDEIDRYGVEAGVCSVEFGKASHLSGVLFFSAGRDRASQLFRAIRCRVEGARTSER